eukprot:2487774-Amphidinium_carterae.1
MARAQSRTLAGLACRPPPYCEACHSRLGRGHSVGLLAQPCAEEKRQYSHQSIVGLYGAEVGGIAVTGMSDLRASAR